MSFRLFVYYCAVVGAWCGLIGWALGIAALLLTSPTVDSYPRYILRVCLQGTFLGFTIAFGLSFLDAMFNFSLWQFSKVFIRVLFATLLGLFAGLFGSFIGGSLYFMTSSFGNVFGGISFVIGWTIVGFFIGISISLFEIVASVIAKQGMGGAINKIIKCLVGGTFGGIMGGVIALALRLIAGSLTTRNIDGLWCPVALGFISIGACIGLLVGLAQVILKEAWIKVEAGFRPGREMLLQKDKVTIGRAEGSDIALFGDSGVEKTHAHIVKEGGRYYLEDLQTPGGTYLNDQKIQGRAPLKAGDLIRVGKSVLRFNERTKRKD
jgi:hypothetical protein